MTLFQAIQKAGGFKDDARKSQVILIRRHGDEPPRGTSIDLAEVESGLFPGVDVELAPYDVVHVPRSSVGNMNLFVEQYITRNLPGGFWWANALFF
jgi:protein involved in polysaccharide export with SLBB domain